jgi:hypothetical protein
LPVRQLRALDEGEFLQFHLLLEQPELRLLPHIED